MLISEIRNDKKSSLGGHSLNHKKKIRTVVSALTWHALTLSFYSNSSLEGIYMPDYLYNP